MARNYFSQKIRVSLAHLPTLMLLIGYPAYWLELYVFRRHDGYVSMWPSLVFAILAVLAVFYKRCHIATAFINLCREYGQLKGYLKVIVSVSALVAGFILFFSLMVSFSSV